MKTMKFLSTLLIASFLFVACSNDDDTPTPVNEEEVITTLNVTLQPEGNGTTVTLQFKDLDGDGPNEPVISSGTLAAETMYNGTIELLNETEDPAEDITEEVEEESEAHQFFYTVSSELNITTEYGNTDTNGNPLGTQFTLTTGTASSGTLTFTLRHEPTKPNTGLADAGGETDISATFPITIE